MSMLYSGLHVIRINAVKGKDRSRCIGIRCLYLFVDQMEEGEMTRFLSDSMSALIIPFG